MSSAADGKMAAAQELGKTVLWPEIRRVLDTYRRLDSDEAKARYADHFLSRTAGVMDDVWPAFYELLKLIEDQELYRRPGYMPETYDSFAQYFEQRVGRPFETWSEMESTYHYAQKYAPDLLKKAFAVARNARARATEYARSIAQAIKEGLSINSGDGPMTDEDKSNRDNITVRVDTPGGTNAVYLTRRIARDRPDILNRMCDGEFPSVRAAAVEAGFAKPTISIRTDDAESAARTIRNSNMKPDTRRALACLLTDDLPV